MAANSSADRKEEEMTRAYILVQTEVGRAGSSVADEIGRISGVVEADNVTGPYDVVVVAESDNLDGLNRDVLSRIQAVTGITRTLTCPVVHL
jgi:DNA-binding Lrp family transcriptional regulator